MDNKCTDCKTKIRDEAEFKALINRLSRIEGQVRGVRGMVENNAYCINIITQISAISAALRAFNRELLASHIRTCVAEDIKKGSDEAIEELIETLSHMR